MYKTGYMVTLGTDLGKPFFLLLADLRSLLTFASECPDTVIPWFDWMYCNDSNQGGDETIRSIIVGFPCNFVDLLCATNDRQRDSSFRELHLQSIDDDPRLLDDLPRLASCAIGAFVSSLLSLPLSLFVFSDRFLLRWWSLTYSWLR